MSGAHPPAPAPIQPKPSTIIRPAILVATKNPTKSRQEAVEAFKKSISFRDCTYAPARVSPVSNNKIRVEFETQAQCDDALSKLRSKPDAPVTAEPARKLKPMILLKGISSDMAPEDLVSTLLRQNPQLHTYSDTDVTFRFKRGNNRSTHLYNAVLVANPATWKTIVEMGRVCLDFQKVHAEDFSPFLQCQKCLNFGHVKKHCRTEATRCSHCASDTHLQDVCPTKDTPHPPKCYNCTQHNIKFNNNHPTTHKATSKHSLKEFITYFINSEHNVALVSEPYTGKGIEVGAIRGLEIFQFPSGPDGRVKACILAKTKTAFLGLSQFSTPNLCVVRTLHRHQQVLIASVYIEPRVDEADTLHSLEHLLSNNTNTRCIIGGDLNGWHPLWGSERMNPRGREIIELSLIHNLLVCNVGNTPTFETITHGHVRSSIIDITLVSSLVYDQVTDWKVNLDACPSSQHNAIDYTYTHSHFQNKSQTSQHLNTTTFLYKNNKANWRLFKESILTQFTSSDTLESDIHALDTGQLESLIDTITEYIHTACRDSMPVRSPEAKCKPPWWTEALEAHKREVIHTHHQLHAAKKSNQPVDALARQLHTLKERYATALKAESTAHFKEFCELQTKENVWSLTNRLLRESAPRRPPVTLKVGGRYTTDTAETAKALLDHFYPDDSTDTDVRHDLRAHMKEFPETPEDPPFTEGEILEALKGMHPKRAPGLDGLTSDICLQFFRLFPKFMTDIMNRCLSLQHFPRQWKRAYVKIIPKPNKTDRTDLTGYRPIGLLPVFGKLLEKLFISRVTYVADKAGKLSKKQFGFRPQTNTTAAIHAAIDLIKQAKTDKLLTVAVSLDIKAAFDNAWWPALFHRLRHIGCPRNIYGLILSYTNQRTVMLDHAGCRASKTMSKGCIQGSTCGPHLWNIILDELLEIDLPPGCRLQAFADDVLLVASAKTASELQDNINSALHTITSWGKGVKLSFSPAKTQALAFNAKAKQILITMDSHTIHFQKSIKFLDVVYTVSSMQLSSRRIVRCVWLGVRAHEPRHTTLASSLASTLASTADNSLVAGNKSVSSRHQSVSLMSQCGEEQIAGEYAKHYVTLKQIGKGAYGCVKMAYRRSDRLLAVAKFILKEKVGAAFWSDAPDGRRVPLELSLLMTLSHPNIVSVIDVFENDKYFQMVMEKHGAGMDLFEFIERRPRMDEPLVSYIFRQIGQAVEYLHSLNILHRDIKDENVIIDNKFHVKLIDFGSATFMSKDTLFSTFYGTTEYCSPEVLAGNKYAGPELEMWSMGITLYVLTFFVNPFSDIEDTIQGPLTFPQIVSDDLEQLLRRMLCKEPAARCTVPQLMAHPWIRQPVNLASYNFQEIVDCDRHEANPEMYFSGSLESPRSNSPVSLADPLAKERSMRSEAEAAGRSEKVSKSDARRPAHQLSDNYSLRSSADILDISSKPVSEAALTDISSDATGHAACDIDYDCDQYECDSWDECEQDSFS
ncbi:unnamed protein product [Danaus chrysippus]|uniref:(African queen) hypothetical protein n=1 Tax=Danaus chrysippus TaxID=151541 RepID=A0A8J2W5V2_9NEOP|nr:unnamed protein product [Danaus chrysippus]